MKRTISSLLLVAAGVFLLSAPASSFQNTYEELIIQVPGVHPDRNLEAVSGELTGLNGIIVTGFCPSQSLLLLKVDRKIQHDDKLLLEVFYTRKLEAHIKTGVTIQQVTEKCTGMVSSGDSTPVPASQE